MIIRCPNCSTTYKVDGSVFDAPKPSFRCSRCKHVFTVHVRLQLDEERSDAEPEDPGSVDDDVIEDAVAEDAVAEDAGAEDAGAEDAENAAVTAPAVDPPPPTLEDEDVEEFDTDDAGARNPELPYPEFDLDPEGASSSDEPEVHTFDQGGGSDAMDAESDRPRPDFEIDDDFLIPPRREVPPPPLSDTKGSVVPFVSLIGLILFAAGLVTLIHMINPQPLDGLLRRIPWYGAAVFDSKHYQSTLVFESLVSGVRPVLNQTEVFVVSGKLVNRNDQSMRQIQIEAQLFDAEGKQVGKQVTFVGNAISPKILEDMSLREISLLQSLKPQSAYHIPPNGSADFTIVFPKPEAAVASFSCRVLAADDGAA